jgi:hypothetical protein
MGIGKSDRSFGKSIEVGRSNPGMPVEWRDVIVEIVNRDEQNMRL